jgi:NADPH2:quinone reductase
MSRRLNPLRGSLHYCPRMRAVVYTGAGGNEVIRIEERPDPEPGTGEVLIAVRFAGLNPADVQQREGRYPAPPGWPPDVPGLEVAGTVVSCGPGVFRFTPGDRVLVGGGGLASRVIAPERCLSPAPDSLGDEAIASVAEGFITAHDAIRSQAGLTSGETLLVHGAAGGVGSAACQIGLACGARVLGVVRSDAAAATIEDLGAEAIRDDGFVAAVLEATDGVGAHVLLELVGAVHFPHNLEALAEDGRIVIVGSSVGGPVIDLPTRLMMTKRATVKGTTLRARTLERKALTLRAFEREVLPHLASGRITPLVDSVYPVERLADAFDRLSGPGKAGKVLIEFE